MALIAAPVLPRAQVMADRLRQWAGLTPPVHIEEAVRKLKIDVEELRLSGSVAGMLVREEPGRWLIIINSRCQDPRRRRFTIAHELGHWTLHRPLLRRTSLELGDEWEKEADEFAGHLLLPPNEVQQYVNMVGRTFIERDFGVSQAAANAALRRLGYQVW